MSAKPETLHKITMTAWFEDIDDAACDAICDALNDWMAERGVNFYVASNGLVDPSTDEYVVTASPKETL